MSECALPNCLTEAVTEIQLCDSHVGQLINPPQTFADIQTHVATTAKEHGFWDVDAEGNPPTVDRKLMLIVGEIAEAQEEWRAGRLETWYTETGKPEGFFVELADAVIRIMDLCEQLGHNLEPTLVEKDKYNEQRPYKHGKQF